MKSLLKWLMVLAVTVGTGTSALAQGPPPGPPPHHDRIANALGLSAEQQAAWEAAHKSFWTTTRPMREQARELRKEIDALIAQGNPDPAVVGQKTIALHGIHQQIKAAHDAMDSAIASMLTPEQKLKLDALKAAHPMGHRGFAPPKQ
jgi:Spy/CpxP family protein refolding chaperone